MGAAARRRPPSAMSRREIETSWTVREGGVPDHSTARARHARRVVFGPANGGALGCHRASGRGPVRAPAEAPGRGPFVAPTDPGRGSVRAPARRPVAVRSLLRQTPVRGSVRAPSRRPVAVRSPLRRTPVRGFIRTPSRRPIGVGSQTPASARSGRLPGQSADPVRARPGYRSGPMTGAGEAPGERPTKEPPGHLRTRPGIHPGAPLAPTFGVAAVGGPGRGQLAAARSSSGPWRVRSRSATFSTRRALTVSTE